MRRPKQSAVARSVDELTKNGEARMRWGVAICVSVVALAYLLVAVFVRGCVHR